MEPVLFFGIVYIYTVLIIYNFDHFLHEAIPRNIAKINLKRVIARNHAGIIQFLRIHAENLCFSRSMHGINYTYSRIERKIGSWFQAILQK